MDDPALKTWMTRLVSQMSKRDRMIIASALSLCPVAELGDRVGGNDVETAARLIELAEYFDADTADNMRMFQHQFNRPR